MIKQDILEKQVRKIYLAIGSNLGNKKVNIEKAKIKLLENEIEILRSSSFYETLSWPNQKNPKFLNVVIEIKTRISPFELLKKCKKIEIDLGRKKGEKNSPRKCDIDIIDYKNKLIMKNLICPHPRMHKRNFVLFPLFELNKQWRHPISNHSIKKLISSLPYRDIRSIKQI